MSARKSDIEEKARCLQQHSLEHETAQELSADISRYITDFLECVDKYTAAN